VVVRVEEAVEEEAVEVVEVVVVEEAVEEAAAAAAVVVLLPLVEQNMSVQTLLLSTSRGSTRVGLSTTL
jgi:hypothetical protein